MKEIWNSRVFPLRFLSGRNFIFLSNSSILFRFGTNFRLLKKPPLLCKGGGFERQRRRRWDRFAGERSLFLPGGYKTRTNSVGETCGLPPPRRYKTPAITIPQSPYGASSLCSKEPLNSVICAKTKGAFQFVGEGFPLPHLYCRDFRPLGCPTVVLCKSK